MRNFWRLTDPTCDTPGDGGAGGGGTPYGGSQGAGQAGGTGTQGSGTAAGGSGGTAYHLTDDSMVHFGDGKAVRYGDHRGQYMPRSEYDRGVKFLMTAAEAMEAQQRGNRGQRGQTQGQMQTQAGGRQQPQQQQQFQQPQTFRGPQNASRGADQLFEGLGDMAVVDGRTVEKLGRQFIDQGFAPLGQAIQAIGQRMEAMEARVAKTEGAAGAFGEQQNNAEFERHIDGVLTKIPEIKGLGMVDPKSEIVREIARDLWLSHDQKDPTLLQQFPTMLANRVTQLWEMFKGMQTASVARAQDETRKKFANPNRGSATGTGTGEYRHMTGRDIAAMAKEAGFFGGTPAGQA